ncbi:MAG: type II toxin-antitoxin system VapC family toxin [Deltaproteobacteria bacterium]|nr:type II toxin-antitoxin system VapC family toxin [Deltaproteobacteria bacterium]
MIKVVPDTNILIDWFRERKHSKLLFGPGLVRYLSSVVAMELYAGANSKKNREGVDRLYAIFEKTRRVLVPAKILFPKAGRVLDELRTKQGYDLKKSVSLSHDVLIALSALSIGAIIITENRKDFLAIRKITGAQFSSP